MQFEWLVACVCFATFHYFIFFNKFMYLVFLSTEVGHLSASVSTSVVLVVQGRRKLQVRSKQHIHA